MKIIALTAVCAAALFATKTDDSAMSTAPLAGAWKIDPVHSSVVFKVKHAGASWFYGTFDKISGSVDLDGKDSKVSVLIDAQSVDTNNEKRDGHLMSPDFFDAKQFPDITFKSKKVSPKGDNLALEGELTVRGITKPLEVVMRKVGEGEFQGKRIGYEASFVMKRSDFGMEYGIAQGVLSDEVTVIIAAELVEAE